MENVFSSLLLLTALILTNADHVDAIHHLTIASVVAYDSVQNQIAWHIRGLLLGSEELKAKFGGELSINHEIIWKTNMSQGPDMAANVVQLASKLYYAEREKNHSVIFCHPGSFEDIYQLGAVAQEWNSLLLTTVGSSYVITPQSFPTVVSMTYRQQRSFAEFMMVLFDAFSWRTSLWLCDQETSTGVYAPSVCFNAGKIFADHSKFTVNMIDFNSKKTWDPVQLLQSARKQSRIIVMMTKPTVVRIIMLTAAKLDMISGDYVFLTIAEFWSDFEMWKQNDTDDEVLLEAYRVLLIVSIRNPLTKVQMDTFNRYLTNTEQHPFIQGMLKNGSLRASNLRDNTKPYNFVDYQTVTALGTVIREALDAGIPPSDGGSLARMLYGRHFRDNYSDFYVDHNALRVTHMEVKDFNIDLRNFKIQNAQYSPGFADFTDMVLYGDIQPEGYVIAHAKHSSIDWGPSYHQAPKDEPVCGFLGNRPPCNGNGLPVAIVVGSVGTVTVVLVVVAVTLALLKIRKKLNSGKWWELDPSLFSLDNEATTREVLQSVSLISTRYDNCSTYAGSKVHVHPVSVTGSLTLAKTDLLLLNQIRELSSHHSINSLRGFLPVGQKVLLLSPLCERGTLRSLFQKCAVDVDLTMQTSLIWDLLKGVSAIHGSHIGHHGSLSSSTCWVDKHFTLRICELGYDRFTFNTERGKLSHNLWTAPELAKSQTSDLYSVGVIMAEICIQNERSQNEVFNSISITDAIYLVMARKVPCSKLVTIPSHDDLISSCWHEQPEMRPTIQKLTATYRKIAGKPPNNLASIILQRLQRYSRNLENAVAERILDLRRQQTVVDELLCQVMPQMVVRELRAGRPVCPETFDCVTVCFTSFDGFAHLVQSAHPEKVLEFLNEMVVAFDRTLHSLDVYRVEVVGDGHVLASGVPHRNENTHAVKICDIALALLQMYSNTGYTGLRLRAGAHSGPIVSAIVGTKLPKYSLVGDTINTASRMMSHGEASRLHVSEATQVFVCESYGKHYNFEQRTLDIKGKGSMITYWVVPSNPKA